MNVSYQLDYEIPEWQGLVTNKHVPLKAVVELKGHNAEAIITSVNEASFKTSYRKWGGPIEVKLKPKHQLVPGWRYRSAKNNLIKMRQNVWSLENETNVSEWSVKYWREQCIENPKQFLNNFYELEANQIEIFIEQMEPYLFWFLDNYERPVFGLDPIDTEVLIEILIDNGFFEREENYNPLLEDFLYFLDNRSGDTEADRIWINTEFGNEPLWK